MWEDFKCILIHEWTNEMTLDIYQQTTTPRVELGWDQKHKSKKVYKIQINIILTKHKWTNIYQFIDFDFSKFVWKILI